MNAIKIGTPIHAEEAAPREISSTIPTRSKKAVSKGKLISDAAIRGLMRISKRIYPHRIQCVDLFGYAEDPYFCLSWRNQHGPLSLSPSEPAKLTDKREGKTEPRTPSEPNFIRV